MQLARLNPVLMAAMLAAVGGLIAGAASLVIPLRYRSEGLLKIHSADSATAKGFVNGLIVGAFSRSTLAVLNEKYDLYSKDGPDQMRRNIRIQSGLGGQAFSVAFSHEDQRKAQRVAAELMDRLIQENVQRRATHVLEVIDSPGLPDAPMSPERFVVVGAGLGAGALLGTIVALMRRRVSQPAS